MVKYLLNFLLIVLLWDYWGDCNFATSEDEEILSNVLTKRLTKRSPPKGMIDNQVYVYIDLYQIVEVDERNGVLTLKLWVYNYYRVDEELWNPDDYSGVTRMQFPMDTFWRPDVSPLDAIELKYQSYNYQTLSYDGTIAAWSSLVTIKFSCSFEVTQFPFDEHDCLLKFGQWVFDDQTYTIGIDPIFEQTNELDLAFYNEHDQWKLIRPLTFSFGIRPFRDIYNFTNLYLNIRIKRLPEFYTFIFIVPSVLLYILAPLVFLLPVESGEKTSMAITLLLAQVVSLSGLSSVLPASSTNFPILSYYMGMSVVHMGVVTVFAIIVINIHGLSGCHHCPKRLQGILSSKYLYLICMTPCPLAGLEAEAQRENLVTPVSPKRVSELFQAETKNSNGQLTSDNRNGTGSAVKKQAKKLEEIQEYKEKDNVVIAQSEETMERMWKYFAVFLDRVLFITNFLTVLILTVIFTSIILK